MYLDNFLILTGTHLHQFTQTHIMEIYADEYQILFI